MKLNNCIFKHGLGDCTNKGLSSTISSVTLHFKSERISTIDAKGFSPTESVTVVDSLPDNDMIVVEDQCCGTRRLRAIPVSLLKSGKWTMFGGNFAWTSDSRGFEHPVKIHDRVES